jgi:hypothetical protein
MVLLLLLCECVPGLRSSDREVSGYSSSCAPIGLANAGLEPGDQGPDTAAMARTLETIGEDGLLACARRDGGQVVTLLMELIGTLELGDEAAAAVCRMYEEARSGVATGDFVTACRLFQALRET